MLSFNPFENLCLPDRTDQISADFINMESEDHVSFEEELTTRELPEILIVDDNTFNVYSLKLLIEEHFKYHSEIAYSGQEALTKFK